MKAIQFQSKGEPTTDTLKLVDIDTPTPKPHEVLIKVEAAGINYADIMMGRGLYLGGPEHPFIPGFEAAGTIEKLGDSVQGYQEGQRVAATTNGQAYAQYATANATGLIPLPDHVSFEEGAAFPVVFLTAYHCLNTCGKLAAGESVLIHAAAGGVGTAAVQLAKAMEATIYATASNADKLQLVKDLGADVCINYKEQDFLEEIRTRTDGKGVDVILESVGGEVLEKSQKALATWGRLVVYGAASAQLGQIDPMDLLFRNKSVIGFHLGHMMSTRPELGPPSMMELFQLWQTDKIKPVIGKSFPLEQAADALTSITERHSVGKVLLLPHA